jgi:hypothetical protein
MKKTIGDPKGKKTETKILKSMLTKQNKQNLILKREHKNSG